MSEDADLLWSETKSVSRFDIGTGTDIIISMGVRTSNGVRTRRREGCIRQ